MSFKGFARLASALAAAAVLAACANTSTNPTSSELETAGLVGAWRDAKATTHFVIGSDSTGHNETCKGATGAVDPTPTFPLVNKFLSFKSRNVPTVALLISRTPAALREIPVSLVSNQLPEPDHEIAPVLVR